MPSSYANDPFVIAQNDNVISVNTALEIDLTALDGIRGNQEERKIETE